jgi:hypothetical protein
VYVSLPTVEGGYGLAVCDKRFCDGLIRVLVRFNGQNAPLQEEWAGIVLGYHSESGGYLVAGLGGLKFAYSIREFVPAPGWFYQWGRSISTWRFLGAPGWVNRKKANSNRKLRYKQECQLEVTLKGQRISLVVDDDPVLEYDRFSPLPGNQLGMFAMSGSTSVIFQGFKVQRRLPIVFVAMPYGESYDSLYRTVIRPISEKLRFEIVRIDEVNRPGLLDREIWEAKVVIAEITTRGSWGELAQVLNMPTILLAKRGKGLPLHIRSDQVLFYDDSIRGRWFIEKKLHALLQPIFQEI